MYRLIEKLRLDRYISSRLIFALDLLVSVGASIISLLVASILLGAEALIWKTIGWWLGGSVVFSWIAFVLLQTHKSIIRHATLRGLGRLSVAVVFKGIGIAVILALGVAGPTFPAIWITLLFDILLSLSGLVIMRVAMVVVYDWLKDSRQRHCKCQRILIYGTGDKGVSLVTQLQNSQEYQVVGFLTYGKTLKNHMLADLPVYYFETEEESEGRKYGKSKEHRPNPIVTMGLFMDAPNPLLYGLQPQGADRSLDRRGGRRQGAASGNPRDQDRGPAGT